MTPRTCPPTWWLSDCLLNKRNQQILEKARKTADRANAERSLPLLLIAWQLYRLHVDMEIMRLRNLANQMELHGVDRISEDWHEVEPTAIERQEQ